MWVQTDKNIAHNQSEKILYNCRTLMNKYLNLVLSYLINFLGVSCFPAKSSLLIQFEVSEQNHDYQNLIFQLLSIK